MLLSSELATCIASYAVQIGELLSFPCLKCNCLVTVYVYILFIYLFFIVVDFVIHWNETAMGYMCSPSRSPLPPPSPPDPSRFSQCIRSERLFHASNLGWWSVSPYIIYMFRCCSLETSHPRLLPQSLIVYIN